MTNSYNKSWLQTCLWSVFEPPEAILRHVWGQKCLQTYLRACRKRVCERCVFSQNRPEKLRKWAAGRACQGRSWPDLGWVRVGVVVVAGENNITYIITCNRIFKILSYTSGAFKAHVWYLLFGNKNPEPLISEPWNVKLSIKAQNCLFTFPGSQRQLCNFVYPPRRVYYGYLLFVSKGVTKYCPYLPYVTWGEPNVPQTGVFLSGCFPLHFSGMFRLRIVANFLGLNVDRAMHSFLDLWRRFWNPKSKHKAIKSHHWWTIIIRKRVWKCPSIKMT